MLGQASKRYLNLCNFVLPGEGERFITESTIQLSPISASLACFFFFFVFTESRCIRVQISWQIRVDSRRIFNSFPTSTTVSNRGIFHRHNGRARYRKRFLSVRLLPGYLRYLNVKRGPSSAASFVTEGQRWRSLEFYARVLRLLWLGGGRGTHPGNSVT